MLSGVRLLGARLLEVVCLPTYDQLISSWKNFCFAKKNLHDIYLRQEKAPVPRSTDWFPESRPVLNESSQEKTRHLSIA